MNRHTYRCPACDSANVRAEASAEWCNLTQSFVTACTYDAMMCLDCDHEDDHGFDPVALPPLSLSLPAIHPIALPLTSYDATEVHPCAEYGSEDARFVEQCDEAAAQFYSVYLHLKEGGVECVADYATPSEAMAHAAALTAALTLAAA